MTLDTYQPDFERAMEFLERELRSIRTGRANTALVEDVLVEAYEGTTLPIQQLATITVPDAKTIVIEPWDKTVVKVVEASIRKSQPNLNPVVDGQMLRIPIPPLTEDSRKELAKRIGVKVEEAKQRLRHVRDKARGAIQESERQKEISEDDRYRLQKDLDDTTASWTEKLKDVGERKRNEVMTM
jgi:ribosome recycling factor